MSKFSERLKSLREKKNLLGKDFATIMNVEPATVTNWEKGNRFPKDDVLIKIADYFDCSIDYLLGRTDDPSTKIYSGLLNNEPVQLEVDNHYPHKLTPENIQNLLNQLEAVGLNIDKLIETAKNTK